MNKEAQRIAIAEACGWVAIDSRRWGGYTETYKPLCSPSDAVGAAAKFWGYIPDYLTDLNAMHEAEKTMFQVWPIFIGNLEHVCERDNDHPVHATAAQRCEAFLQALKLWTDEAIPPATQLP